MHHIILNESSQGIPILFLHGWGGSTDSFLGIAKKLQMLCTENNPTHNSARFSSASLKSIKIILVDFPAHGKTPEPKRPLTVSDFMNEVLGLLSSKNIKKVNIVAHSFGGRVALKLAALHPNMVNKLVLTDSAGLRPKRRFKYYFKVFCHKLRKILAKIHLYPKKRLNSFGSPDYKNLSPIMKQTFKNIVNEDLTEYAIKFVRATLLIWGSKDKDTPIWMAHKLKKLIKNSELIVFENCGHFAYLEEAHKFTLILKSFLIN